MLKQSQLLYKMDLIYDCVLYAGLKLRIRAKRQPLWSKLLVFNVGPGFIATKFYQTYNQKPHLFMAPWIFWPGLKKL